MAHSNKFEITNKPVTVELYCVGLTTFPVPPTRVQNPLPISGMLPCRNAVESHITWSGPAFDVVGIGSTFITIVSRDTAQGPFAIVH